MRNILGLIMIVLFLTDCGFNEVTIEGEVYNDTNKNGSYDTGEPPLNEVKVKSGNVSTKTGADGSFSLSGEIVEKDKDAEVKIFLSKTGFQSKSITVTIPSSSDNGEPYSPDTDLKKIVMQSN